MQGAKYKRSIGTNHIWKWLILAVLWFLILSLWNGLQKIKGGYSRIEETKERYEEQKTRNEQLKERLKLVQMPEYQEKIIRDELNMQRPGEVVVVLGDIGVEASEAGEVKEEVKQAWQKWWSLMK